MSERISQTNLGKLYNLEEKSLGKERVNEIIREIRNLGDKEKNSRTIFLCHSHLDKLIVKKIILFFYRLSVDIYVDWMDSAMPKVTNRNTAVTIKEKIENCSRFLFLATYSGLKSKWCDWELGLAYSLKGEEELAILPIESKSGKWHGSEYLKLYPVMLFELDDFEFVTAEKVTIRNDSKNREKSLIQWLENNNL